MAPPVVARQRSPTWARILSAPGTVKETVGSVNVPVICGGQRIVPGNVVMSDTQT
ncbi:hypothetical protein [Roseovarius sp.]|uniref:RraA family protein n=1 Tax=Roseovarius sp. TaxID=1486281 RepID=UPI003562E229